MGVVFRAEDIWLERQVAIKMVDAAYAGDEATSKYFQQEARALAQIRHDNVVHVYSFGRHDGVFYFAMEYVDGLTLDSVIEELAARGETIELERAFKIIKAVARGLGAVHDRKLLHRDVKPGNVVLERETNRPVIVDFGLARRARSSNPRMTTTAGTPSYMPPEQARDVDGTKTRPESDIYALACTAFELLTGRSVFEGADVYAILLAHMNESPPLLSSFRPDLVELDALFARALAKSAEHRHHSCAEFLQDFELRTKDVFAPRSSRPSFRPSMMPRMPQPDALRLFLLEDDPALARQITRAADRALAVPTVECFTRADELVSAFERSAADVVVIDEDTISPPWRVVHAIRQLANAAGTEFVLLCKSWDSPPSGPADAAVRELPKPLNMHVLGSVLRGAGQRSRSSRPPALRL